MGSLPLLTVLLMSLSLSPAGLNEVSSPAAAGPAVEASAGVLTLPSVTFAQLPSTRAQVSAAADQQRALSGLAGADSEALQWPIPARPIEPLPSPEGTIYLPRAKDPPAREWSGLPEPATGSFRWGPAIGSTVLTIVTQNLCNLTSSRFHDELEGPFLNDWFKSAAALFDANWNDGNKFQTNYIAHPIGGAVYANNARLNDPKFAKLRPGDDGYGKGVLRAMAFSAVASLMYEIGPVSEASIGNLGMKDPDKQAWVDPVVTPVLGAGWMVFEDILHEHVLRKVKGPVPYTILHIFMNPARTVSLLMNFRPPCPR
jgi:hypothetical protein